MMLANSMAGRLLSIGRTPSDEPSTIHRVPPNIRQCNEDAYKPRFLSIGPYHHGNPSLHSAENLKWRYLHSLLSRNTPMASTPEISKELEKFICKVQEYEGQARQCYSETITMNSEVFVEMMVLDGCFLVELLSKYYMKERSDPVFTVAWLLPLIRQDLLRLENQFPFFLLQHLFDLARPPLSSNSSQLLPFPTLKEISFIYLAWKRCPDPDALSNFQVHHLLHLYSWILRPTSDTINSNIHPHGSSNFKGFLLPMFKCCLSQQLEQPNNESSYRPSESTNTNLLPNRPFKSRLASLCCSAKFCLPSRSAGSNNHEWPTSTIPSASELQEAGVRFKCKKANSFLDIEFKEGVLEIPNLSVVDSTNCIFRNVIAYEQSCADVDADELSKSKPFTSYVLFMDCLVNTSKDVAILKQNGILENKLGSDEEVALLLNQLLKEIIIPYQKHHFAGLFQSVNRYCGSTWHKNRARLKRDYFRNPWTSISVTAAAVLIAFNFTQVLYAALTYSFK